MKDYLMMLFFLVPGFISMFVYRYIAGSDNKKNDFENTITALSFNTFIISVNLGIMALWNIFAKSYFYPLAGRDDYWYSVTGLTIKFGSMYFCTKYALMTLVVSILIAFVWDWFGTPFDKITNFYRTNIKHRNRRTKKPVIFCDTFIDYQMPLVKVEKSGRVIAFGAMDKISDGIDCNLELTLGKIEEWRDYENCLKIKQIYYDCERDLKITEFVYKDFIFEELTATDSTAVPVASAE